MASCSKTPMIKTLIMLSRSLRLSATITVKYRAILLANERSNWPTNKLVKTMAHGKSLNRPNLSRQLKSLVKIGGKWHRMWAQEITSKFSTSAGSCSNG